MEERSERSGGGTISSFRGCELWAGASLATPLTPVAESGRCRRARDELAPGVRQADPHLEVAAGRVDRGCNLSHRAGELTPWHVGYGNSDGIASFDIAEARGRQEDLQVKFVEIDEADHRGEFVDSLSSLPQPVGYDTIEGRDDFQMSR